MPSPENNLTQPENPTANRKNNPQKPPQEQPQKCPRCDSSNTKFCYYNNYSLTQPRHFCKTCRRYWTRGGALRNVPIGGGCRKTNKRLRAVSSTPSATTSGGSTKLLSISGAEFGHHGFKFLASATNLNPAGVLTPAVNFDLGPKLHPATAGVYTQYITSNVPTIGGGGAHATSDAGPYFGLDLMGLNYSTSSSLVQANISGNENQISISSIESLSSINQEMHWKLQQQRLSMIYGPVSSQNNDENTIVSDQVKPQEAINLFGNNNNNNNSNNNNNTSPTSNKMDVGPNEWLFDNQISNNYGGNLNEVNTSINMGVNTTNNSCDNVNRVVESNLHGVWGDLLNHNRQC